MHTFQYTGYVILMLLDYKFHRHRVCPSDHRGTHKCLCPLLTWHTDTPRYLLPPPLALLAGHHLQKE